MKKTYLEPEMEVIELSEDVLMLSFDAYDTENPDKAWGNITL